MYIHQWWEMAWLGSLYCVKGLCVKLKTASETGFVWTCTLPLFLSLFSREMKLTVVLNCDWTVVDHVRDIWQSLTWFSRYINKTICKSFRKNLHELCSSCFGVLKSFQQENGHVYFMDIAVFPCVSTAVDFIWLVDYMDITVLYNCMILFAFTLSI